MVGVLGRLAMLVLGLTLMLSLMDILSEQKGASSAVSKTEHHVVKKKPLPNQTIVNVDSADESPVPLSLQPPPPIATKTVPKPTTNATTLFDYSRTQRPLLPSLAHCVSENFLHTAPAYRSCQYRNLCYDSSNGGNFVFMASSRHQTIQSLTRDGDTFLSSVPKPSIATPVDSNSFAKTIFAKWNPEVRNFSSHHQDAHWLNDDMVIIPLYPWKYCKRNGGQALWDLILPLYTLLEIFELHQNNYSIVVTEIPITDTWRKHPRARVNCLYAYKPYFELLGWNILYEKDMMAGTGAGNNTLICSKRAVAGIGFHMDHAPSDRGPLYKGVPPNIRHNLMAPHNMRRTQNLAGLRSALMVGSISDEGHHSMNPTLVTFCITDGSDNAFASEIKAVGDMTSVQVQTVNLANTTLKQQIAQVRKSAILVAGEGEIPGLFLEKGASLILYGKPSDLWLNYANIKVHFMEPTITNQTQSLLLVDLIRDELNALKESTRPTTPDAGPSINFMNQTTMTWINATPPTSRVHCIDPGVAHNNRDTAFLFRSCHYENLCFDLDRKTFVVFSSNMTTTRQLTTQAHLSTISQVVINGGQNRNALLKGRKRWLPETNISRSSYSSYYQLRNDTIWISFHPHHNCNGGHLLWDCIMPIFSLLDIFGHTDKNLFLTEEGSEPDCAEPIRSVLNLKQDIPRVATQVKIHAAKSNLVCSRYSANGMSWLTDHGVNGHGKVPADFWTQVNLRRGPEFARFRKFLLDRMNLVVPGKQPHRVVFSILSSRDPTRRTDFSKEIAHVKGRLQDGTLVDGVAMWNYTWREQVQMMQETAVYISIVGGGTAPAFFLPKGSTLILLGSPNNMLDWDLWNNYAQVRVQWLSLLHKNDTDLLLELVVYALESLEEFQ